LSYSITETRTFTISHARYVTSKIAADLDLLRAYYGWPSADWITRYAEEAAILLNGRYMQSVEYGFERNGKVIFSLKYVARWDGTLQTDDRPGRVPFGLDVSNASGYSYLHHSDSFLRLNSEQQAKIESSLPIRRSGSPTPEVGNGYWEQTRSYSTNGEGVVRSIFRPL
jgi:hypothetical protein